MRAVTALGCSLIALVGTSSAARAEPSLQEAPVSISREYIHEAIDDHTRVPYLSSSVPDTRVVLAEADQHPDDPLAVLTIYKNSKVDIADTDNWNREHAWPISYGGDREDDRCNFQNSDLHALFAGDPSYNSSRGNKFGHRHRIGHLSHAA